MIQYDVIPYNTIILNTVQYTPHYSIHGTLIVAYLGSNLATDWIIIYIIIVFFLLVLLVLLLFGVVFP